MGLGQMMLPQGTQGLGLALQEASPLLMAMSQGLRSGQGAMAYAPQGMAAMMLRRENLDRKAEEKAEKAAKERSRAEAARLVGGFFGGGPSMTTMAPRTPQPPRDPLAPQAIANDALTAIGKNPHRELLAKTLMAEAGGEGPQGMLAAGAVINNRLKSGGYGGNLQDVIMKPGQFSAWNGVTGYAGGKGAIDMDRVRPSEEAYRVADALLAGQYEDPTGGATHYYNPAAANPGWGMQAGGEWSRIGNHVFGSADAGRQRIDPERAQAIMMHPDIPNEVKQMVLAQYQQPDPMDALNLEHQQLQNAQLRQEVSQGPDQSAPEAQIGRIMQTFGVDQQTAVGIVDGVLKVSQDPVTREIMVTNLATNETWQPSMQQQGQPPQQPPAAQQPGDLSFGNQFEGAPGAFGIGGAVKRGVNAAADVAGAPVPFPAEMQAQQDFAVFGEGLINAFAAAYGRQPPSWLLKNIEALTPKAGTPFEGPGEAQEKLRSIGRDMLNRRRQAEAALSQRISPDMRQEQEALIAGIDSTLGQLRSAISAFTPDDGLRPEVSDRMKAYE